MWPTGSESQKHSLFDGVSFKGKKKQSQTLSSALQAGATLLDLDKGHIKLTPLALHMHTTQTMSPASYKPTTQRKNPNIVKYVLHNTDGFWLRHIVRDGSFLMITIPL